MTAKPRKTKEEAGPSPIRASRVWAQDDTSSKGGKAKAREQRQESKGKRAKAREQRQESKGKRDPSLLRSSG
jgi:hypothetical protein